MKTSIKIILFLTSMALLAAMAYPTLFSRYYDEPESLIAVPKISGGGIPIKNLEEINDDRLILTYENLYDKRIEAVQGTGFSVTLKGTNYTYPVVMGYGVINGRFFTRDEQEYKNKELVLNKKAAFDILGTLDAAGCEIRLDGSPYLVVGVIDDKDEEHLNLYIPATCFSESVESVAVSLSGGVSAEYALNELKSLGVNELKYDFLNLKLLYMVIKDKAVLALEVILFGFLLLGIKKAAAGVAEKFRGIKGLQQRFYAVDLLKSEEKHVQKLVLMITTTAGMITAETFLIQSMFKKILLWSSVKGWFENVTPTGFALAIACTERWHVLTSFLFLGFIATFAVFILLCWE